MENIVENTLVTTSTFYKKALPLLQEMMNSYSTKVQFDELSEIMINRYIKHIATKGIHSPYGRSQDIVLFGEDSTSQRDPS